MFNEQKYWEPWEDGDPRDSLEEDLDQLDEAHGFVKHAKDMVNGSRRIVSPTEGRRPEVGLMIPWPPYCVILHH